MCYPPTTHVQYFLPPEQSHTIMLKTIRRPTCAPSMKKDLHNLVDSEPCTFKGFILYLRVQQPRTYSRKPEFCITYSLY